MRARQGSTFRPDLQARIDHLLTEIGYSPDAELTETRHMLDIRYDDLRPIPSVGLPVRMT
jgi:hypothetical protein